MDIKQFVIDNASEILISCGTLSLITSVPLACKNDAKERKHWDDICTNEPQSRTKRVLHKVRHHIPTIALMTSGVIEIAIGVYGERKEKALLATMLGVAENRANAYANKLEKLINDKTVYREHVNDVETGAMKPFNENYVTHTGYGSDLCYDTVTGRYFRSSVDTIKNQIATINSRLSIERYLTLNEVQMELGLKHCVAGTKLGVSVETTGFIDVRFDSFLREGYEPCIEVIYTVETMDRIKGKEV